MNYSYVVYNEENQVFSGKLSATNDQAALDMLMNVGYRVVSLKPLTSFLPSTGSLFRGTVKPQELVTFSRQLALLFESGVGIVQALELLQNQMDNKEFKRVLIEVVADLRSGGSLSSAMSKHPNVFNRLYCKMVGVGEQTGGLESVLRSLAEYTERQMGAMKKLKSAMTYPLIVFCLAIVVGILLITVVLPPFVRMFSSLGGELPLPTVILLGMTDFLNAYGLYLLIGILAVVIVGFLYSKSQDGRYLKDRLILKLPLIGRVSLLSELSRACRSLALLFRAGIPLPDVMNLTAQASNNLVVTRALNDVEQDMLRGEGIAKPLRKRPVFLPLMAEMTKVGEETGNLDEVLITVAQTFEVEADTRIQTILSLIEPVMTIGMALMVGFLAVSVFLPMYSSLSLVGG